MRQGGLLVVPAAPALTALRCDGAYREALLEADLAIADSAFMVLLWNLLEGDSVSRLSGLEYFSELVRDPDFRREGSTLYVMASEESAIRNVCWLRRQGIPIRSNQVYVAPIYGMRHRRRRPDRTNPLFSSTPCRHHRGGRRSGEAWTLPEALPGLFPVDPLHWSGDRFPERGPGLYSSSRRPFSLGLADALPVEAEELRSPVLGGAQAGLAAGSLPHGVATPSAPGLGRGGRIHCVDRLTLGIHRIELILRRQSSRCDFPKLATRDE